MNETPYCKLVPVPGTRHTVPIYIFVDKYIFGRYKTSSYQIADKSISGTHCKISK